MYTAARRHVGACTLLLLCLALLLGTPALRGLPALPAVPGAGPKDIWIMVDTASLTLSLMQGEDVLLSYDNIAIGSRGATWSKHTRDEKTPLGDFRINEIRVSERFRLFLSLDYPNLEHATLALQEGRLDADRYQRIELARARGAPPPQDTPLGGHLGIHGLGAGNPEIHNDINWTDGCVALTNEQVEELAARVSHGTLVRIR